MELNVRGSNRITHLRRCSSLVYPLWAVQTPNHACNCFKDNRGIVFTLFPGACGRLFTFSMRDMKKWQGLPTKHITTLTLTLNQYVTSHLGVSIIVVAFGFLLAHGRADIEQESRRREGEHVGGRLGWSKGTCL